MVGLLVVMSGAPVGQNEAAASCRDFPQLGLAAFDAPGTHPVGVRTLTFVDPSRPTPPTGSFPGAPARTLVTEIWYPAHEAGRDAAVDAAGSPYPVVVYSHGGSGQRLEGALVGEHLASRGMIVAAADYPLTSFGGILKAGLVVELLADIVNQPGDWSVVLDGVLAAFGAAADPGRVGATGFSVGGLTTLLVSYHRQLRDPRIRATLPMAPPGCFLTRRFYREAELPLLIMHGDSDQVAHFREEGRTAYRRARRPRLLARLANASHLGFSPLAGSLDHAEHYDRVGCAPVSVIAGDDPERFYRTLTAPLGDRAEGIRVRLQRCTMPCGDPVPDVPAMRADRHHQLTRATVAAFFEAYLSGDDAARCFLRRTLGRESDVQVRSSGAR
jgi:predicted dienelactone hydrolase